MSRFAITQTGLAQAAPRSALFGPQVTHWTQEGLGSLRLSLLENTNLKFLSETLSQLPSLWPLLKDDFGGSGFCGEQMLKDLAAFVKGESNLDPLNLSNTHLAPLTIVSQVVGLVRLAGQSDKSDLLDYQSTQGFCVGFLSAASLASSSNWAEFARNTSNSLRLATCIGIAIDAEDSQHAPPDRAVSVSIRWKSPSDRAYLETCLDVFPEAYVSCVTDDQTLTITLPHRCQISFDARLQKHQIAPAIINLTGSYHHSRHRKSAQVLKKLSADLDELQLPSANELRLPLRSTIDADIITAGSLREIAIDAILCKRAHWFQTVKNTLADFPHDDVNFVALGSEFCIPRSLMRSKIDAASGISLKDGAGSFERQPEEVAIVGMSCRFSNADSLQEFWDLIKSGSTSVTKLPTERFDPAAISREPKVPTYWGNFLRQPGAFDHRFFGISGREAKFMDPQQRLALEVAYEALESSGYCSLSPAERQSDVGCYLGVAANEYEENILSEGANAFSATGTLRAFVSGRVSHFFGWSGPSIVFDTACSSSSVAIHTACRALVSGECSMALAGGVNVLTNPGMHQNLVAASFLSPNGGSRAFDAAGSGYCRGEGAGILVLKKLSKAIQDDDAILGVIAGTAVNQGSACNSITVPSSQSQSSLYKQALSVGRIKPEEVAYVEAHGTGTPIGDPIEYESIRLTLTSPNRRENLFLGSVKDNIGHTEAASGVAGIIKSVLMMQHNIIPKQANFVSLSPRIQSSSLDQIIISKTTQPWTAQKRVVLINNYGASGSNAAVVLRKHETASIDSKEEAIFPNIHPLLLSAKSAKSLQSYVKALQLFLPKVEAEFAHFAYNLTRKQDPSFGHRAAFVAATAEGLLSELEAYSQNANDASARKSKLPVVLCFGGQTGRNVFVSRELYESCDIFRIHLNECDTVCLSLGLPRIIPAILDAGDTEDIVLLHCMLLSLQISSAKSWIDCGLRVDTLIGHSFGQLAALCVAGSISLRDMFRLVSGRARLIRDNWGSERGAMLSVECSREEIEAVVSFVNSTAGLRADVACYNGPRSFVVAGDTPSIDKLEKECSLFKTKRLQNTHAYHSYISDGIMQDLRAVGGSIRVQRPLIRIETCSSNQSWSQFTAEEVVQHTRQPVYFSQAVERTAARLPEAVWLEAGSASPVVSMARRILRQPGRQDVFLPMDLGRVDAMASLANAACELWSSGSAAIYWAFHRSSSRRYKNLTTPPYQFEKTQHWIDYEPRPTPRAIEAAQNSRFAQASLVSFVTEESEGNYLFSVNSSHATFDAIVRGHAVAGQSICPASMYTELAARCAASLSGRSSEAGVSPHFEGLVMNSPLGLGGAYTLYLRLCTVTTDSWEFSIFSLSSKDGAVEDAETEHAKGQLSFNSPNDIVAESRLKLLKRVASSACFERIQKSPSATGVSGPMVYKLLSDVVDYAPFYRQVRSMIALENEAVGSISITADQTLSIDPGITDPIALDNFLQAAGILINCLSTRRSNEVFVCTAIEEVVFSAPFLANRGQPHDWTVYTRYEKTSKTKIANDIFVYDASSKELVMAIMGANFQSVPFKHLVRSFARLNDTSTCSASSTGSDTTDGSAYQSLVSSSPLTCYEETNNGGSSPHERAAGSYSKVDRSPQPPSLSDTSNLLHLVREMFSSIMEISVDEIEPTSMLSDLGVDSLLGTEVLAEVHKRFKVNLTQVQFQECTDVNSLCRCIQPEATTPVLPQSIDEPKENQAPISNTMHDHLGILHEPQRNSNEGEDQTGQNLAVLSSECFHHVKPAHDQYAKTAGLANFLTGGAHQVQSELVARYVVEAFASLGTHLGSMRQGDEVRPVEHLPKHRKLMSHLFKILENATLISQDGSGTFRRTAVLIPSTSAAALSAKMLNHFPQHASETKILHTTAHRLADCLTGKADHLSLLFGDSVARGLLEDVYLNGPVFKAGTMLLSQYVASVMKRLGNSREIKILEIGAGTGGTTQYLTQALSGLGCKFSYTFSDISSSLVANARRKFAEWPFMRYAVVDIERSTAPELMGAYDIVISSNCIHATQDLVKSTTNIRKILRADGVLCLVELTRDVFWLDLVFGLLEGWWLFNDGRAHALADERHWERCLRAAGFQWVDWSTGASAESSLLRVITASPFDARSSAGTSTAHSDVGDLGSLNNHALRQTMAYKNIDGLNLLADIYYPPDLAATGSRLPVALMLHGGGHVMLSRNDIRPDQTKLLLKKGFLPISVDYRLCPETTLRDGPMADVRDALAWIRTVLPTLSLARPDIQADGERVVCVGWSTGGHLAMTLAWNSRLVGVRPPEAILAFYCPSDYEDAFWVQPNIPAGSDVKSAAIQQSCYELDDEIWAGLSDNPITEYNVPAAKRALGGWMAPSDPRSRLALYMNWHGRALHVLLNGLNKQSRDEPPAPTAAAIAAVSPLAQARNGTYKTPTFIIHPRKDDLIPWQQAQRTWEMLRSRGLDAELRILEDVPHLFDLYRQYRDTEAAKRAVSEGYEYLCKYAGLCN